MTVIGVRREKAAFSGGCKSQEQPGWLPIEEVGDLFRP